MGYRKDLIPGVVLSVFSIIYLALSFQIDLFTGSGATPLNSRFAPQFWGSILLFLSVLLIFRGLKAKKQVTEEKLERKMTFKEAVYENREVWLTFGALFLYILGLDFIGFMIMTVAYVFVQIMILTAKEKRNYVVALVVALVTSVVIDYVFVELLHVMLPTGILGF